MNQWQIKTLIFLLSVLYVMPSYAGETDNNLLATGYYNDRDVNNFPLIATSSDRGLTWSYCLESPGDIRYHGRFEDISCNAEVCLAAGYAERSESTYIDPLIAVSKDKGKSWTYSPIQISQLHADTLITSLSCNNSFCAIAGFDGDGIETGKPVIAISKDQGQTWSYPKIKNRFSFLGHLDGMHCFNDRCVAVGVAGDGHSPLIVSNTNQEWSYRAISDLPPHPFAKLHLHNVRCSTEFCIAAGYYEYISHYSPLFLRSIDQGVSWSIVKIPTEVEGGAKALTCQGNMCLASGYFKYQNKGNYFAVSHDAGISWIYSTVGKKDDNFNIITVAMGKNNFIAGGYDRNNIRPMIAISHDKGITWSSVPNIMPPHLDEGIINNIACDGSICMATGYYHGYISSSPISYPFLAMSYDDGETWSFPDTIISKLPNDYFFNGDFNKGYLGGV